MPLLEKPRNPLLLPGPLLYLLIPGGLLLLQFLSLCANFLLYDDNPFLLILSTLIVLLLPGLLIFPLSRPMGEAYERYGIPALSTLIVIYGFVIQLFLCIVAFMLELNISDVALLYFVLNLTIFAFSLLSGAWKKVKDITVSLGHQLEAKVVLVAFLIIISVSLYQMGSPLDSNIGGEMLRYFSFARKVFENPVLTLSNVSYRRDTVETYIIPLWEFTIALISKVAHLDVLIVFIRLRWIGFIFSLLPLFAIGRLLFRDEKILYLSMNIISALCFTGIFLSPQDYCCYRGVFSLMPYIHTADIAMDILIPMGMFLILYYFEHGKKSVLFLLFLFLLMSAFFHVREYFQLLFYIVSFAPILLFFKKREMKNYLYLLIPFVMVGLIIFLLQSVIFREQIIHAGNEFLIKSKMLDEIHDLLSKNPAKLFAKPVEPDEMPLDKGLSLIAFLLLPFAIFAWRRSLATIFILSSLIMSFMVSQVSLLYRLSIFFTYSEFMMSTGRLSFIFVYLVLAWLIARMILIIGQTRALSIDRARRIPWTARIAGTPACRVITFGVMPILVAIVFLLLQLYISKGIMLEQFFRTLLYAVTCIYLIIFLKSLRTPDKDNIMGQIQAPSTAVHFCIFLTALIVINPDILTMSNLCREKQRNLWTGNIITGIDPALISFVRGNLPPGSVFSMDPASRTSLFIYADVYVDNFPPLVCQTIIAEREVYEKRNSPLRPIYGSQSSGKSDIEYIREKGIEYILFDPISSPESTGRFENDQSGSLRKIYAHNGYKIFKVERLR